MHGFWVWVDAITFESADIYDGGFPLMDLLSKLMSNRAVD